ncbi:bifunctional TH2 protein, mitochondrial isoform X2 [Nematostella vectensis]|uniref:bifunctional TH2 protein, mitochondrial isoform X2 n=1 Tax=Nematostella vectensis TaxID=45351 RepID=UPI0013900967|nr:bifunctional TH2 protein, mitochondrial isoform X2 [Nematostella vectensis]XP_048575867.1 bifunctional TH2 protein, mitochondrial isoform X2 [Nematostella vectensis]
MLVSIAFLWYKSKVTMGSTIMALDSPSSSHSGHDNTLCQGIKLKFVAFDFDGTCTTKDTTGLYYKATDQYRDGPENVTQTLDKKWGELGKTYFEGHTATISKLLQETPDPIHGLNIKSLKEFLSEVYEFDSSCTKRVDDSKLLAGVTKEGIKQVSKLVELRPGCTSLLNKLDLPLHVISFNWSEDLIKNVISLKHVEVSANDFQYYNNGSRYVGRKLSSPQDKENEFIKLMQRHAEIDGLTVFIGDSIGDLLPLLKANIGIVIGNNLELRKVAAAFGIKLVPLTDFHSSCLIVGNRCQEEMTSCATRQHGKLYATNSWDEIGSLLIGPHYESDS